MSGRRAGGRRGRRGEEEERPGRVARFLERFPPVAYLGALLGLPLALVLLGWAIPSFRHAFVDPYLWLPIVNDEGYNPINTAFFMVLSLLIALWAYRILVHHGEKMTDAVTLGGLPFAFVGAALRVLEDSDFFAPFDLPRSCADPSHFTFASCFGIMFVNPILFTLVAILLVASARVAFQSTLVSRRLGAQAGLRFYGLTLAALVALYGAVWAASPGVARFIPTPFVALLGALLAFAVVMGRTKKQGEVPWGFGLLGYSLVYALPLAYLVAVWLLGGTPEWHPEAATRPWVLGVLVGAPTLLTIGVVAAARCFAGPVRKEKGKVIKPRRSAFFLAYLFLLEAAFLLAAVVSLRDVIERNDREMATFGYLLLGPLLVPLAVWFARYGAKGGMGTHPGFGRLNDFLNQQILWAQAADAFMTSLAVDLFGAGEKHVLARGLIRWAHDLNLPAPLGSYPAAVGLFPFKLLLSLVLIWIMDLRLREFFRAREQLSTVLKSTIVVAGLGPAIRDALRIAMGV